MLSGGRARQEYPERSIFPKKVNQQARFAERIRGRFAYYSEATTATPI